MPHFFISYRRDDYEAKTLAHILCRELRHRFDHDSVFLDVDSRTPGLSFPTKVEAALERADVVLALIGPSWLRTLHRRLGDEHDWLRFELTRSLQKTGLPVVPVCLPGVRVPHASELPRELRDLASRDGITLDPHENFDSDLNRFLHDLQNVLLTKSAHSSGRAISVGTLVEQYRHFDRAGWHAGSDDRDANAVWRVIAITDEFVEIELVEGCYRWGFDGIAFQYPPYRSRRVSSDVYKENFPERKGNAQFFDEYRMIER